MVMMTTMITIGCYLHRHGEVSRVKAGQFWLTLAHTAFNSGSDKAHKGQHFKGCTKQQTNK